MIKWLLKCFKYKKIMRVILVATERVKTHRFDVFLFASLFVSALRRITVSPEDDEFMSCVRVLFKTKVN